MKSNEYIPGVCNIGPGEVKKRRTSALLSLVFLVACAILLFLFVPGKIWRLTLFIPGATAGLCVQQWYKRFCYGFAMAGVFNFADTRNKVERIAQDEFLRKDRATAQRMLLISVVVGIVIAVGAYLLPVVA